MSIERLNKDLLEKIYSRTGAVHWIDESPCEVCDKPMLGHEWVEMDEMGFVMHCSNETPVEPIYLETLDEQERTNG